MRAHEILTEALGVQEQRAVMYDAPNGERSMGKAVTAFNAIYGTQLTEVMGWHFMELLKIVRSTQGAHHADNFIDAASYASLAGEAAGQGRS